MAKKRSIQVFSYYEIVDGGRYRGSMWLCASGENVGRIAQYDGLFLRWIDDQEFVDGISEEFTQFTWISYVPKRLEVSANAV